MRFIHKRLSSISKGVYEDVENLLNNLDCVIALKDEILYNNFNFTLSFWKRTKAAI
ncbi:hypothetical protein ANAPRD1_00609 [Anaplasma phagocytophilum]|nr:hypothetical protein ANAPRD1_00609 [Anaplasma phagocytophilum]